MFFKSSDAVSIVNQTSSTSIAYAEVLHAKCLDATPCKVLRAKIM